jgi:hypothetical protein
MTPEKFFAPGSLITPLLPHRSQPLEKIETPDRFRFHEIVGVSDRAMKLNATVSRDAGRNSVERKDAQT